MVLDVLYGVSTAPVTFDDAAGVPELVGAGMPGLRASLAERGTGVKHE